MDSSLKKRLYQTGIALIVVLSTGTIGYYIITDFHYTPFTCFYMTVITVTTIGYDEIINLAGYEGAREFTIFIAFSGIGVLTYFVSTLSAVIIDGRLRESFKKRKMQKTISSMKDHFIICGVGKHSLHLIEELNNTERETVCIDINPESFKEILNRYPGQIFIEGDATLSETLEKAGINNAAGLFATTDNDNVNLVICLLARNLSPKIKIISLCINHDNKGKIKMAGADHVVSPNYIGAIRMANEMVRPEVTTLLEEIFENERITFRIEQIELNEKYEGKKIGDLKLNEFKDLIFVALKTNNEFLFKPDNSCQIKNGDTLIVIATPEGRILIEKKDE